MPIYIHISTCTYALKYDVFLNNNLFFFSWLYGGLAFCGSLGLNYLFSIITIEVKLNYVK